MNQKILISYSQSPLYSLHSYWNDSFTIIDEKFNDFSQLKGKELWIDAYIDLYDPRLVKPEYLYHFFARIHQICDDVDIQTIRILRNYSYSSTNTTLNKIFYLYRSFVHFFIKAYGVLPIYIPDVLNTSYKHHPYNQLKNSTQVEWSKKSLFRVIQEKDIIMNLLDQQLEKEAVIISGIKVSLVDLNNKIIQIFGRPPVVLENAYEIHLQEPHHGQILSELNYNLESALIQQLS